MYHFESQGLEPNHNIKYINLNDLAVRSAKC